MSLMERKLRPSEPLSENTQTFIFSPSVLSQALKASTSLARVSRVREENSTLETPKARK